MGDDGKTSVRDLDATKRFLVDTLSNKLAQRTGEPAEVSSLLEAVQQAETAEELNQASSRLLAVLGVPVRRRVAGERRAHQRRPCSLMLRVLEDGHHGVHFIRDIGTGGVSIYVQPPMPLFPVLHCQLPLYHLGLQHSFTARVVWCQPDPPAMVGLEFMEVADDALAWIRSFLATQATHDSR